MKTVFKILDAFGVLISILWFVVYAGGGAFLLAKQATAGSDYVSPYAPLVIFLWIVGFFVGHRLIGSLFLLFVESKKVSVLSAYANPAVVSEITNNIDFIQPIYSSKIISNSIEVDSLYLNYAGKTNYNKKETSKIIAFLKSSKKTYKVPACC